MLNAIRAIQRNDSAGDTSHHTRMHPVDVDIMQTRRNVVLAYIADNPNKSIKEIGIALGKTEHSIRGDVNYLHSADVLTRKIVLDGGNRSFLYRVV